VTALAATSSLRPVYRRALAVWVVLAVLATTIMFFRMATEEPPDRVSNVPDSAASSGGPGSTAPGINLVVTPKSDATMEVTESVLLDEPTESLEVRPPDFSAAGSTFAAKDPYASKVRIVAGDQSVQVADGVVNRPMTLDLDEPARRFEMRYELNRAVVRSKPSAKGRALGAVRPLTSGVPNTLSVAVVVLGDEVRNLACPGLSLADQSCAVGAPPLLRLRTDLPWRTAIVVIQLDLKSS
jgi:hypothetical protein